MNETVPAGEQRESVPDRKNLDFILDIPLQLTVELGRTKLLVKDVLQLNQGSVVELTKLAGEPLDVFVNSKLVARGEAVVVGLILVLSWLGGRWMNTGGGPVAGQRYIRLVETRYLAPKKSLFLVEVAGEYLLLASSGEQLNFIKQIDMVEEIEVIGSIEERQTLASNFRERLSRTLRPFSFCRSGKSNAAGSGVGR